MNLEQNDVKMITLSWRTLYNALWNRCL